MTLSTPQFELDWMTTQSPEDYRHLYHYTTATSMAHILDSGRIRFGPLSQTNDPVEYNQWFADLFFSSQHVGASEVPSEEIEETLDAIDRLLRRNVCVGCFTTDRLPSVGSSGESFFHLGWARARMWDQYAAKHTGACLVFDQVSICEDTERACAQMRINFERAQGNVKYTDERRVLKLALDAIRRDGIDVIVERVRTSQFAPNGLYYRKNLDWESESEYRITVIKSNPETSDLDQPIYVEIENSLEALVVGENFPETELSVLRHRRSAGGLQIFQCLWVDGEPVLELLDHL